MDKIPLTLKTFVKAALPIAQPYFFLCPLSLSLSLSHSLEYFSPLRCINITFNSNYKPFQGSNIAYPHHLSPLPIPWQAETNFTRQLINQKKGPCFPLLNQRQTYSVTFSNFISTKHFHDIHFNIIFYHHYSHHYSHHDYSLHHHHGFHFLINPHWQMAIIHTIFPFLFTYPYLEESSPV